MGAAWRPAIRCDSTYRNYIDSLHASTILDKNQIMRLMMFVAAHSHEFIEILTEYKRDGVTTLPIAPWHGWEDAYWLNQTYKSKSVGVTIENLENEEVSIQKGEGGVIKVDVSSLF